MTYAPKHKAPWKTAEEVRKLTFTRDERGMAIKIGAGAYGKVFSGRIVFVDGTRKRVAIKIFKDGITDSLAELYRDAIPALRAAGLTLPKMGLVRIAEDLSIQWIECGVVRQMAVEAGDFAQVTPLFGSTRMGSKLFPYFHGEEAPLDIKLKVLLQLTALANQHYPVYQDVFVSFRDPRRGAIPIDIDSVLDPFAGRHADSAFRLVRQIRAMEPVTVPGWESNRRLLFEAVFAAAERFLQVELLACRSQLDC